MSYFSLEFKNFILYFQCSHRRTISMKNVYIANHPLIHDKITWLRDKNTGSKKFRQLIQELSIILAVEATSRSRLKEIEVEGPLEKTTGHRLNNDIVLVPILRAGLGMVNGFMRLMPDAKIGYLGVYRNETTLEPVAYYENLPSLLEKAATFVLDPMLATGGTAAYCLSLIKKQGGKQLSLITVLSAPEGIEHVTEKHPDVKIITGSVERELNEHGYILPGLGDAGDRLNGTF